jgi:hypothetical protein
VEPQQSLKSWNVDFDSENGRLPSPSEHPDAQHYFSWCRHSPNIQPLHSTSHWTVMTVNKRKKWRKWPPYTNGTKDWLPDTNQCHRHVPYDMAKSIQISRVTSANTMHSTKISAVNCRYCKQLSNDVIDPLFSWYLWVGSVKAESQWAKYPNLSVRSFVTSKKPILEFYSVVKSVEYTL